MRKILSSVNYYCLLFTILFTFLFRALRECLEYGYEVEFTGVGPAPPGQQESVGFCSQIGVFRRLRGGDDCRAPFGGEAEDVFSYELVSTCTDSLFKNLTDL